MQLSLLEKIGFSFMLAAWIAWGSNLIGNALVYAEPLQVAAFKIEGGSGAASGTAEKPPAEQAAGGSDISALLASADASAGAKTFLRIDKCSCAQVSQLNTLARSMHFSDVVFQYAWSFSSSLMAAAAPSWSSAGHATQAPSLTSVSAS
ncbi:MAG: hypothetical protein IIA35_00905, partial [Proteobacteria bacterium]|nr:hypothetical protein [Pseudomonadota bacterium]